MKVGRGTKLAPAPVYAVEEHNSGQWLEVVWLGQTRDVLGPGRKGGNCGGAGWYVRRICPCHAGGVVSRRYDEQLEAQAGLRLLVITSMGFDL